MSIQEAPNLPECRRANKAGVAEFFGVSLPTVDAWLRRGCPVLQRGMRGVPWVFDLLEVAEWRGGGEKRSDDFDPRNLPPRERKDWVQSEREWISLEKDLGNLVDTDDVARGYSLITKAVASSLDSLPDILERDAGLGAEALEIVQRVTDELREQMYQRIMLNDD